MREQDPRVPLEVEQYLIDLNARAGQLGGGAAGARGGARGAARLQTVVEERVLDLRLSESAVLERIAAAYPKAKELPTDGSVRIAIPLGLTGLNHVVVDVMSAPADTDSLIRAYGKEGFLNRKPTARIADQVAGLLGP